MDLSQQHPRITAEVLGPNRFNEIDRRDPANNLGINPNIRQSLHRTRTWLDSNAS